MPQILLATYNGERFLQQQLDSIAAQTDPNWSLLIRDDHSKDRTPEIIEKFRQQHPDKVEVVHDHADGRPNNNIGGASQNFAKLLEFSQERYRLNPYKGDPYVLFCDQDDVWHKDKIEKSARKMHEMEREYGMDVPLLIHSDYAVNDKDMKEVFPSGNARTGMHKEHTELRNLIVANVVTGMTMMFNRALAEKSLPIPSEARMHDGWMANVAALFGHIGYISEPLVDYRQHDSNVSGGVSINQDSLAERGYKAIRREGVKNVAKRVTARIQNSLTKAINEAAALLQQYGIEMKPDDRKLIEHFVALPTQSPLEQRLTLMNEQLLPNSLKGAVGRVAVGVYRDSKDKTAQNNSRLK